MMEQGRSTAAALAFGLLMCADSVGGAQATVTEPADIEVLVERARATPGWTPVYATLAKMGDPGIAALVELLAEHPTAVYASGHLSRIGAPALRPLIEAVLDAAKVDPANQCLRDIASEPAFFEEIWLPAEDRTPQNLTVLRDAWLIYFGLEALPIEPLLRALVASKPAPPLLERALARAGERALPLLLSDLGHRDDVFRDRIVRILERMGATAIPDLLRRLDDPDPRVREGAALALRGARSLGSVPGELIAGLGDPEPSVQKAVARTLGAIAGPMQLFGRDGLLVKALADDRISTRVAAVEGLDSFLEVWKVELPPAARSSFAEWRANLGQRHQQYQAKVREDEGYRLALGFLAKVIEDPSPELGTPAFRALARLPEPLGSQAAQLLAPLLEDARAEVRERAAWVFSNRWGVESRALRPALLTMLQEESPGCRIAAAHALARQGEDVLPAIESLPTAHIKNVRRGTLVALERLYSVVHDTIILRHKDAYWRNPPGFTRGSGWVPEGTLERARKEIRKDPTLKRIRELLVRMSRDPDTEMAEIARTILRNLPRP